MCMCNTVLYVNSVDRTLCDFCLLDILEQNLLG
jgi:hypothetical protein